MAGVSRRTVLARALLASGVCSASIPLRALAAPGLTVGNVTGLYSVDVARIDRPLDAAEVSASVLAWPGRIAVGGGRYSMGGQVAAQGGLHLDMRRMNRLIWLDASAKRVRVQAGMRWRDLQAVLDPRDLAVKTMQSYSNFTIGGSVSVNAHGRYVGHGPVGNTVRALQLVLADGSQVEVEPSRQPDLFRAAIGGYGAVGVIAEVELSVVDNVRIERRVQAVPLEAYVDHFDRDVLADPRAVLHNADLAPPLFDSPVSVTWRKTSKALTEPARLVARGQSYATEQNVLWALTELPGGPALRRHVIHPLLNAGPAVQWLNHEASLDLAELEPRTRRWSTYALQEFFIPRRSFLTFAKVLARVLRQRGVAAVNVSIRHSTSDTVSLLPWAREEVFSFVLYFKQRTDRAACDTVAAWTRELIDLALAHGGRYYLPYQLHATRAQFVRAYPEVAALRAVKAAVDPNGRLSNTLWSRYLDA